MSEKKEDLIKKLEEIEFPDIELRAHREMLKNSLINWKYGPKKPGLILFPGFKKVLIPLAAATFVFCMILLTTINIPTENTYTKAQKIAMQNSEITGWIEKGAEIKDIIVEENDVYLLIVPGAITNLEKTSPKEDFNGALVKIGLKEKRVTKIENIASQTMPLTEEDKKRAEDIITMSEIPADGEKVAGGLGSRSAPATIEIEKIEAVPNYNLKLIKRNNKIEISPQNEETERVRVFYKIDGKSTEAEIDLEKREAKPIDFINEDEDEDEVKDTP